MCGYGYRQGEDGVELAERRRPTREMVPGSEFCGRAVTGSSQGCMMQGGEAGFQWIEFAARDQAPDP